MNKFFTNTPQYGDLYFDEIFIEYDGPCIFSVKNALGYRFVCLLESEITEMDRYIVAPVSIERYNAFVKNAWPIRHVFTRPEMNNVFSVSFFRDTIKIDALSRPTIERMNLPNESEMLDYSNGYTSIKIALEASEKNVPILQKSLEKRGNHIQYIFANELAKESAKFQKIFDGIANDLIRQIPDCSKDKKNSIRNGCQVPIFGTYAASFGIQIEGTEYPRFGDEESDFAKNLKSYFELLALDDTTEEEILIQHQSALMALRDYFKTLISLDFAVRMTAATPKHNVYKCVLSREKIIERYNFLNRVTKNDVEQITLIGTWTEINIERKAFKFKTNSGENIKGKFDDDFDESVFDFSEEIEIIVDKKIEINKMGHEKIIYTLLSIDSK